MVEEILREFTQNKDIFNTHNLTRGIEAEQVLVDRKQYNFLKNSYSQLSILLIHYEKLLMELLNRLYIDLGIILIIKQTINFMKIALINMKLISWMSITQ